MACQPDLRDWSLPLIINADASGTFGMSQVPPPSTWRAYSMAEAPYDLGVWNNFSGGMHIDADLTQSYATSRCALPVGYEANTVKNEDTSSEEAILSAGDCGTWLSNHDLRSDDRSYTTDHTVRMMDVEKIYSETASASAGIEPAVAPAMSDMQIYSRRGSSDTSTSSSSEPSKHSFDEQPRRVDGSNPATAKKRKRARHNMIEKRYREKMNRNFLELEDAISDPRTSDHSISYLQDSMCSDSDKPQWQKRNKSQILQNVLTYIHELQADNARLKLELSDLRNFMNI